MESSKQQDTQRTSWEYHYEDVDAITPCPRESTSSHQDKNPHHQKHHEGKDDHSCRPGRPQTQRSSASSWRSGRARPLDGFVDDEEDTTILWYQMLAVQDRFGCYNSARMMAALEGEDMATPSRTCLDLMNDSIGEIPEDVKQRIEIFLERDGSAAYWKKGKWGKFWHRVLYV
ncbi:hypothetical protein QBC38DRAFT_460469 [Podospora fimiseda]|uniref:Uncharacterized protein n=1 Tax=Podospora fimiseda TaxID=252190 RepID=A0AAN7BGP5_9PEZI|nr:hypothetical protein QBC38DRAFT_460469 [Podospora fimiseda]